MDKLIIFDTTLRDGEQSPGASMNKDEKIRIAKQLEKLGVDIIEAGFPIASLSDFESVKTIASLVKNSTVCGLARAVEEDLKVAGEAIKPATSGRIHTFIATSPIHMQNKLKLTPDEVVERAVWAVKYARNYTDNVEFSPEDAGRSNLDFLCSIIEKVIDAGATTINIPDTVGYNTPEQFGTLIKNLIFNIKNSDKAVFSTHCHNDLGMAVANSLAGVLNGARQVECTINGLGERAGNAALEEIIMAVKTRKDIFNLETSINTKELLNSSRLVAGITGFNVQPNKAIVGINAFAHESGIHQDGVLKKRETYEIMLAQDVGWQNNTIVLGKHSGRAALKEQYRNLGIEFSDENIFSKIFIAFKNLSDKKHNIYDEDLMNLYREVVPTEYKHFSKYKFIDLQTSSKSGSYAKATLTLKINDKKVQHETTGAGLVDATFKAIEALVNSQSKLLIYSVNNVTDGTDALGETGVRLEKNGRIVNGNGTDSDIIVASAKAYIDALNRLETAPKFHPQAPV